MVNAAKNNNQTNNHLAIMNLKYPLFLLLAFTLLISCNKKSNNPCDGLMNESPPVRIGILLIDKQTGDNLVLTQNLTAADIKVTQATTGALVNNWRILNNVSSPMNGMLEMAVFHEKAGEYFYHVEIKGLGNINLSYSIKQLKTNNPCKTYYYPLEGLKAIGHDFQPFSYENKVIPYVIKVAITL